MGGACFYGAVAEPVVVVLGETRAVVLGPRMGFKDR
jgi:hypothetical protein